VVRSKGERLVTPDIHQLIETQGVERKKSLSERKAGLKALDAMVNSESATGTVIFGVAPDGTVVGLGGDLDQAQRSSRKRFGRSSLLRFRFKSTWCCVRASSSSWLTVSVSRMYRCLNTTVAPSSERDLRTVN